MTLILKIMGMESAGDSDSRKSFRLVECDNVEFIRAFTGRAFAQVYFPDDGMHEFDLDGCNAYVMNYDGKTVATFGSMPIPDVDYAQSHEERMNKLHEKDYPIQTPEQRAHAEEMQRQQEAGAPPFQLDTSTNIA